MKPKSHTIDVINGEVILTFTVAGTAKNFQSEYQYGFVLTAEQTYNLSSDLAKAWGDFQ